MRRHEAEALLVFSEGAGVKATFFSPLSGTLQPSGSPIWPAWEAQLKDRQVAYSTVLATIVGSGIFGPRLRQTDVCRLTLAYRAKITQRFSWR